MAGGPNLGANVPNLGTNVPILGTMGSSPLADALFGRTRRMVLGLLFSHPDQSFYTRQIARHLGLGLGALQRELERLTSAGILLREAEGRQVYYRAHRACPIYAELQSLLLKTVGLADVVRAALAPLAHKIAVAFVYGSMAQGRAQVGSDVDVMVIGDATFAEVAAALNPTQDTLGRDVNPSVFPPTELKERLRDGNHFLTTVLGERKLFLIGDADELARLAAAGMADRAPDQQTRDRGPLGAGGTGPGH